MFNRDALIVPHDTKIVTLAQGLKHHRYIVEISSTMSSTMIYHCAVVMDLMLQSNIKPSRGTIIEKGNWVRH